MQDCTREIILKLKLAGWSEARSYLRLDLAFPGRSFPIELLVRESRACLVVEYPAINHDYPAVAGVYEAVPLDTLL